MFLLGENSVRRAYSSRRTGEREGRGGNVLTELDAYTFETSIVRKPPPRHERLEHYITKEIDGASIGVEAQFVVTAEGGG